MIIDFLIEQRSGGNENGMNVWQPVIGSAAGMRGWLADSSEHQVDDLAANDDQVA